MMFSERLKVEMQFDRWLKRVRREQKVNIEARPMTFIVWLETEALGKKTLQRIYNGIFSKKGKK